MTRAAVLALGATLVLCVLAIATLAYAGRAVPDVLSNLAVGDLAALAALLRPGELISGPQALQAAPKPARPPAGV